MPAPKKAPAAKAAAASTAKAPKKPAAKTPRKASPKAAPKAAPASGGIVALPTGRLVASDLNPRKTFDETATAELADSIAAQGLLQNLVVRPLPAKRGRATHEVVAGGRRLRALQLLVKQKRMAAGATVPVRVIDEDDDNARAIAILENLQRADVPPVEEGDAFRQLVDAGWKTAHIAERIGKTPRYVQNRIKVVDRLATPARDALADGRINLAQAEAICDAAPELQEEAIECITGGHGHWQREEDIRASIREEMPPASYAIFEVDPALVLEGEDGEPDLIRSRARFDILQAAAVEKLQATLLEQGWAAAPVVSYFSSWNYQKRNKADGGHAVIVLARSGEVTIEKGVIDSDTVDAERRAAAAAAGPGDSGKPAVLFTQSHLEQAGRNKTAHMHTLVAHAPETALRAAVYGLLCRWTPVRISGELGGLNGGDEPYQERRRAVLEPLAVALGLGTDRNDLIDDGWFDFDSAEDGVVWRALEKTAVGTLLEILAVLVAENVLVSPLAGAAGNRAGENDIAAAAAAESGLPLNPPGLADGDWLARAKRPELMAIAAAAGMPAITGTMKAIRAAIAGNIPADYVPVPGRFLTEEDAAAAIAAEFPDSAGDAAAAPAAIAAE